MVALGTSQVQKGGAARFAGGNPGMATAGSGGIAARAKFEPLFHSMQSPQAYDRLNGKC